MNNKGFTLIELMIAVVIFMFLFTLIIKLVRESHVNVRASSNAVSMSNIAQEEIEKYKTFLAEGDATPDLGNTVMKNGYYIRVSLDNTNLNLPNDATTYNAKLKEIKAEVSNDTDFIDLDDVVLKSHVLYNDMGYDTSILFSDDFNDGTVDDGWTEYPAGCSSSVWGNALWLDNSFQGDKVIADGTNFTDFEYEANIAVSDNTNQIDAGLIFRVSNPSIGANNLNGYYAGIGSLWTYTGVILGKFNSGNYQGLAIIPTTINTWQWYNLKVRVQGSSIRVYLNDVLMIDVTDSQLSNGGIGLRTYYLDAVYDNIIVRKIQ